MLKHFFSRVLEYYWIRIQQPIPFLAYSAQARAGLVWMQRSQYFHRQFTFIGRVVFDRPVRNISERLRVRRSASIQWIRASLLLNQ